MSYIVQSKDLLQVNRINEEEVEEMQYDIFTNNRNNRFTFIYNQKLIQTGQQGQIKNKVKVTYETVK